MNNLRNIGRLLGGLLLLSGCVPSYARVDYGAEYSDRRWVDLYAYDPYYYGDWRYNYRSWSPVVVYEYGGRYYPDHFRGARAVQVYRDRSGYFLPPRDRDWDRADRRFDNRRRPNKSDYERARPREERPRRP
jgi:hypothetical protein